MGVGGEQIQQRSLICQPADTSAHRDVPIGAYFCVDRSIAGSKRADGLVLAVARVIAGEGDGRVFCLFCMTADIGPICIDEAANHPARRKLIVVSSLHREKTASAAKITESRTVILIDLSQNCPGGAVYGACGASDTVGPRRLCIYIRVEEPDAPANANRKSGPGLDRRWRSIRSHIGGLRDRCKDRRGTETGHQRPVDF